MAPGDWLARGRGRVGRRWWRAWPWLARANGGNCSIRGATRRRHAVGVRLMVQNPRWRWGVGRWAVAGGGRGRGWGELWPGVGGWVGRWWRAGPWLARANGGNCSIRAATRRRHAVAVRLMVQNPPLSGPVAVARRAGDRAWAGDPSLVAVGAVDGVANGGNCSIRGATRRRHAVAMRLMVQNPPLSGGAWAGERWPGGQATGCGPVIRRWWRARWWLPRANGGIAALGVRHAGDTPWRCV